jgi:hypothetical protein
MLRKCALLPRFYGMQFCLPKIFTIMYQIFLTVAGTVFVSILILSFPSPPQSCAGGDIYFILTHLINVNE